MSAPPNRLHCSRGTVPVGIGLLGVRPGNIFRFLVLFSLKSLFQLYYCQFKPMSIQKSGGGAMKISVVGWENILRGKSVYMSNLHIPSVAFYSK